MNKHSLPSVACCRHSKSCHKLFPRQKPDQSSQGETLEGKGKLLAAVSRRDFVKIVSAAFALAGLDPLAASGRKAGDETPEIATPGLVVLPMVEVAIDPYCERKIKGISELKRECYFNLNDPGANFDKRCGSEERYEFLVKENGISFGGTVNVVNKAVHDGAVTEDAAHPGFADRSFLKRRLAGQVNSPSDAFKRDMGVRLDVVAHEKSGVFPKFMGEYTLSGALRNKPKDRSLPANIAAAAQLAADTLRWGYTDFDRPAFYEPVNEPAYVYWKDQHLAEWHLAARKTVHAQVAGVRVGGPCLPVAYFYRDQYRGFDGLRHFIDNTRCSLDFYSFHVYDFLKEANGHFFGRVTSGLPLESVLDLVENYTVNAYGKEVGIVVSEHGGLDAGTAKKMGELARNQAPDRPFEWELEKRSVENFNMVSSAIANTLVFMDHPQTVLKAVPFILLDAFAWNPEEIDVLYLPRNFTDKSVWISTPLIMFYGFFRDLKGRRVTGFCPDPDIQTRAFADGSTLFVVLNNLSERFKTVGLNQPPPQSAILRRFGRHSDNTPYLLEQPLSTFGRLDLQPREALLLKAEYGHPIEPRRAVNEISLYGDQIAVAITRGEERFVVRSPGQGKFSYATLLIGVSRPPDAGWSITVTFNGQPLEVPLEQCAERLVDKEYASCKRIQLDPATIKDVNVIGVSFPDQRPGAVGSVVIRAGLPVQPTTPRSA